MNKLIKSLPALALVLAATFAFAFGPKDLAMNQYGEATGQWYNVTGITPGPSTYTCDQLTDAECLHDAVNGNPINPDEDKVFVKRGTLPPAD
ncbi:DUF6520 family protein [Algoriphagus sp. D3-2-R+10]|mgnify:CR=1 FL=1|uniref:DUF6520 family protein n=1 Tax=Algoriphagus aurantiacus TaxID=3103948 RepID=UPI002B3E96C9|nr:DUF6520 family protein [Algoriphagus sp. D3-2-R+10]MEB2777322.1 DUF6520 family protein [Algoriphagus sp. D3-2-R+10]|tara:strand:- start:45078 stop:45353 length:276 start_codon:yes stop_codon:yes gene_type:complete